MDSFPVKVCHNICIPLCRLVRREEYWGRCVAKREYFYGVKVYLILTQEGLPVEVDLLPGSAHDARFLRSLPLHFEPRHQVYADSAFTLYLLEDLQEREQIRWQVQRKGNSQRGG